MRGCPSRQCRNDNKKLRSTWMRLMCPQSRQYPRTQSRQCPRTQSRRLLGFARDANEDAQRGRQPGGTCGERPRSAEMHSTNFGYPTERAVWTESSKLSGRTNRCMDGELRVALRTNRCVDRSLKIGCFTFLDATIGCWHNRAVSFSNSAQEQAIST